jgi:hypothetical protein
VVGVSDDLGHASSVAAQLRLAEKNGTLPGGGRKVCGACNQRLLRREGDWLVCPDAECGARVPAGEVEA